ncbi:hypothetical protein HWV01_06820 [Moritella sp. 5]|uniref:hypothetical protein n=1 Tax=Moritella sp. 5 TaxID=2746231 RepID=UPI001BA5DBAF|nr:hypothetical protein [Moritella sp. 5]QUM80027.1 hypothetical protein HWV01_06820 [Moritella sp. 5]
MLFPQSVAARKIFILDIEMVQASCGKSVPYFNYNEVRDDLVKWSTRQGKEGIEKYRVKKISKVLMFFQLKPLNEQGFISISTSK